MQYKKLKPKVREIIIEAVKLFVLIATVSMLFYDSIMGAVIGIPIAVFQLNLDKKERKKRIKDKLVEEFKDMIISIDSALSTGASLEKSIYAALSDIKLLYPEGSMIENELKLMTVKLSVNVPIENLFCDFGERSGIREIKDFAAVVSTAGKTGGNLIRIIRKTVSNISMKIDTKREISVITAAKKREQKIMTVMPVLILAYLKLVNPGYMVSLYGNVFGTVFMTICLAVICGSYYLGTKIVDIEV